MRNTTNSETVKKRRKWPVVLLVILLLIGALAGFICWNASRNMKAMNETLEAGMKALSDSCRVTPVDAGEYEKISMYGVMKFDVSQYDLSFPDDSYFGNLSVMTVNMGFMQMVSFVITPYSMDLPLLSMDFMYPFGSRKAYTEFYDLVPDTGTEEYTAVLAGLREFQDRYTKIEELQTDPCWYDDLLSVVMHKKLTREYDHTVRKMFCDAIETYMWTARGCAVLDEAGRAEKLRLTQEYSDNLIKNGGVSTDVFKKQLGEEKTKDFFDRVFFGTKRAQ